MNKVLIDISAKAQKKITARMMVGQRGKAVGGAITYSFALALPSIIVGLIFRNNMALASLFSNLYPILTTGAFTLGFSAFILALFRRNNPSIGEVFSGFSQFFRAFGIMFMVGIIVFLYGIPAIICLSLSINSMSLFYLLGAFALCVLPYQQYLYYSQVYYIAVDHPEFSVMKVLGASKKLMSGNRLKRFYLGLSFLGWGLIAYGPMFVASGLEVYVKTKELSNMIVETSLYAWVDNAYFISIPFTIFGLVWLVPYMATTYACFYEIISGNLTIKSSGQIEENLSRNRSPEL